MPYPRGYVFCFYKALVVQTCTCNQNQHLPICLETKHFWYSERRQKPVFLRLKKLLYKSLQYCNHCETFKQCK